MIESAIEKARARGVYFFVNDAQITLHLSICLAQGMAERGIPVYANADAANGLFKKSAVFPSAAQYIVVDLSCVEVGIPVHQTAAPFAISLRHRTAAVCCADNANTAEFPKEIPIFASHANTGFASVDGRRPWAFGLNQTMMEQTRKYAGLGRRRSIIRNFRPSLNQTVRHMLDLALLPTLEKHFEIDRAADDAQRFQSDHYYERLSRSLGCLAYGGFILEGTPETKGRLEPGRIVIGRWDSYRFWESMAAGALTITLDFDAYGFQLPVMPENRKHYFGIRFDTLTEGVAFLAQSDELERIAACGREWALEHYSPKAVAHRFIETMAAIYP